MQGGDGRALDDVLESRCCRLRVHWASLRLPALCGGRRKPPSLQDQLGLQQILGGPPSSLDSSQTLAPGCGGSAEYGLQMVGRRLHGSYL